MGRSLMYCSSTAARASIAGAMVGFNPRQFSQGGFHKQFEADETADRIAGKAKTEAGFRLPLDPEPDGFTRLDIDFVKDLFHTFGSECLWDEIEHARGDTTC